MEEFDLTASDRKWMETESMEAKNKQTFWEKMATFIVDKRNIFFLFFLVACLFSVVSSGWVRTNDDITAYLPDDTETRQGLDIMNSEFTTYATARVMVSNISLEQAERIQEELEKEGGAISRFNGITIKKRTFPDTRYPSLTGMPSAHSTIRILFFLFNRIRTSRGS